MLRDFFAIKNPPKCVEGLNTTPNSAIKYIWCYLFGHDMEPYNYDVCEPCKRCGIEDDRNCMTPFFQRLKRRGEWI